MAVVGRSLVANGGSFRDGFAPRVWAGRWGREEPALGTAAGGVVARLHGRSWVRTLVSASLALVAAAGALVLKAVLQH